MTKKKIGAIAGVLTAIAVAWAVVFGFSGSDDTAEPPSIAAPAYHSPEIGPATKFELQYKKKWNELLDAAGRCSLQHDSTPQGPQVIFNSSGFEVAARIASDEGSVEILVLSDDSMQIHLRRIGEPNRSLKAVETIDSQLGRKLPESLQQAEAWELEFLGLAQRWLASSAGSTTVDPERMCQR